jgi:hypothetical protein
MCKKPSLPPSEATAKPATLSLCVRAEFVGIALAIQRSSVVMHSAGGQRKRAVVIGGSIGGLFAGLFLRKVGWEVSIHERAGEELGSRGAGIATHDDLHEALALATEQGGEVGVAVEGRIVLAQSGDVVCEVARPQVLASWDRIWRRLRLSRIERPIQRLLFSDLLERGESECLGWQASLR